MKASIVNNRKLLVWLVICFAILLSSTLLVGVSIEQAVGRQKETNRQICVAFNKFDLAITQTLKRQAANVSKLVYFRQHPDELAAQEREIRRQIVRFAQHDCG